MAESEPTGGIGGPFELTSHRGEAVSDRSLRGRPYLAFFGFTHCPDICPTTLFELRIPMKPDGYSDAKPDRHSNLMPDAVPI